jgi:two-component system OmpR family response regulator
VPRAHARRTARQGTQLGVLGRAKTGGEFAARRTDCAWDGPLFSSGILWNSILDYRVIRPGRAGALAVGTFAYLDYQSYDLADYGSTMQILLIEDDVEAASHVSSGLREAGYTVKHCVDGASGLAAAKAARYDLLIVDRMLPQLDGLALVAALRDAQIPTPVLVLSALGTIDDRVEGLRAGGDDYLVKPFAFAELLARVEALLRRASGDNRHVGTLKVADLEINTLARRVTRAGRNIDLTTKEFQLLEYLARRVGQIVTRTMLLESVWNLQFDPQTNLIDVHMSRLRQAIDRDFSPALLHTVRGSGYCIRDPGETA